LRRLRELTASGIAVTLVTPARHHYYSGMGPGMLGGFYSEDQVRVDVQRLTEGGGGQCVIGAAAGLDPCRGLLRLTDGREMAYDALSLNAGSVVAGQIPALPDVYTVKPIVNLAMAAERLQELSRTAPPRLLVVGGGAAGVEIAGNARRMLGERGSVTLVGAGPLLAPFPYGASEAVRISFGQRAIQVIEDTPVTGWTAGMALLADGRRVPFDLALLSTGVKPPPFLADLALPLAPDGSLSVNAFLQSPGSPAVFGGGDCVAFDGMPLARVGVYAVRQGPILYANLRAYLEGRPLVPFRPQKRFLQIMNLGDGTGVLVRGGFAWHGRLPWRIKDLIDRRFVAGFQQ
jgi:NADH dehydrogenase FAD-containing subunit